MDRISALILLIREAKAWDTVSHEDIIEVALQEYIYNHTGVAVEFRSSEDGG